MSKQFPSLKGNVLNLFISNGASFLVPLLQIPYLTRTLGAEEFGLYIFSYSIITFMMIITDYGFELYAPGKIIKNEIDVDVIFTHVLIIKSALFIISAAFILMIFISTKYYIGRLDILTWLVLAVFFNSFSMLWLFQANEVIYVYSRITVVTKLIAVGLIYLFVKSSNDLNIVFAIICITNAATLIISFAFCKNRFQLKFVRIKLHETLTLAKEAFEYFASRLGVSIYSALGGFVIGAFSGSLIQVAYYGAAHQLYSAGLQTLSAISTPLLPYMVRTKNFRVLYKIVALSLFLTAMGASIGFLWGDFILSAIYGEDFSAAKPVLNVFMVTVFFSVLGQQIGYPALVPLGKGRQANLSVIYAGIAQAIMIGVIVMLKLNITAVMIAVTYLVCDIIMSSYRGIILYKSRMQ